MNPEQLPLRDIHLPEAIGFWPPAAGWWLSVLAALLLIVFVVWFIRRLTRKTAWKTAKKSLSELQQDTTIDDHEKIRRLSVLMRRTAISLTPRAESAGLTGRPWLDFLDGSLPDKPFAEGIGRQLIEAPYRNNDSVEFEVQELFALCERWIKAQKRRQR